MAYRKLLLLTAGILGIISFSCKDNPTDIGVGLLKNNRINVKILDSAADSIKQTSSYFKKVIPLGGGTKLLLGNYNNTQGSVLLKYFFYGLPDSISSDFQNNNVTISSAYVTLFPYITFGDSLANFNFTVHSVNSPWGIATFDADSLSGLSYSTEDISSNKNILDSITTFSLDNSLVSNWLTAYIDSNYSAIGGLYLKPSVDTKKLVAYWAYNLSNTSYSELYVVFQKPGVYIDTMAFLPVSDISVVQGTAPQVKTGETIVQGGVAYYSKLSFDISKIPANATINQAMLTLNIDTTQSHYVTDIYNGVTIWNLSDSASSAIDSSSNVTISLSGSTMQGDIASLVQKWVDTRKNQGILIQDYNQTEDVNLYAIKSSKYPDYNARPKLKITYTTRN